MRLLLRANAHRPTDGGLEVAASPDTPSRPDPWTWHIRLLEDPGESAGVAAIPGPWPALAVETDPARVRPDVSVLRLKGATNVERDEAELLALVVASGSVLLEGRHAMSPGDVLVLAGDDPLHVGATSSDGVLAVVRLVSVQGGGPLGWVP
jgi:hypothetical protein